MSLSRILVPMMTVVAALVLALVPWGLSATVWPFVTYLMPLLPLAVIHYWLVRRPEAVPFVVIFAAGLTVDAVTRGPLGFWALIYLLGSAIVHLSAGALHRSLYGRFAAFAGGFVLIGALTWLLAMGYMLARTEVEPVLTAIGALVATYPLLATLLYPFARRPRRAPNLTLDRGR